MMYMNLPPKIRGLVVTTGNNPKARFLKWDKLNLLFRAIPDSPAKENCKDLLWNLLSNYNPDTEIISINIYGDKTGPLYLEHKIYTRPILIEDVAAKTGLSKTEVKYAFQLYEEGAYTPEEASQKTGLSIKKLIELTKYFVLDNFYIDQ